MRDDEEDGFQHADIPAKMREARACMTCSLVKTFSQFYDTGCDNCPFLQLTENRQRVSECTSAYFEGCVQAVFFVRVENVDFVCMIVLLQ